MTTLRKAAQQALEALDKLYLPGELERVNAAITALRAALAQQEEPVETVREPVAWIHTDLDKPRVKFLEWSEDEPGYRGRWIKTPLYLAPPPRQPLTQGDVDRICASLGFAAISPAEIVRAVERAHGIGERP